MMFYGRAQRFTGIIVKVLFMNYVDFASDFHLIPGAMGVIRNHGGPLV